MEQWLEKQAVSKDPNQLAKLKKRILGVTES